MDKQINIPVFEETMKQFNNLQFLRDDKGRWTDVIPKAGWYQDAGGNLYNYDGVVWDVVPGAKIKDLEYLG